MRIVVHSSDSRHRPRARKDRKVRSAHRHPRNRAPVRPARRSRRDYAVSLQMGSMVAEHLYRVLGKPQRWLTKQRMLLRIPVAKSQRSEIIHAFSSQFQNCGGIS